MDVYGTTLESAAYFMRRPPIFDIAGDPFGKIWPASRCARTIRNCATPSKAFDAMKADGTYLKILTKWHLEGDAI